MKMILMMTTTMMIVLSGHQKGICLEKRGALAIPDGCIFWSSGENTQVF